MATYPNSFPKQRNIQRVWVAFMDIRRNRENCRGGDFWARQPKGGAFEFSSQKGVGSHIDPLDALCQGSPASLIDPGAFW